MSSSNAPLNPNEPEPDTSRKRPRSRWRPLTIVLALLVTPPLWIWYQQSHEARLIEEVRLILNEVRAAQSEDERTLIGQVAIQAIDDAGITVPYPVRVDLLHRTALYLQPSDSSPVEDAWFLKTDFHEVPTADLATAAFICFGTGRFASAERLVSEALNRGDSRIDVLRTAATIRFDLGRDDDTLVHCRELIELLPADPNPWLVMCYVYRNRDDNDQLVKILPELISRSTDKAPYQLELIDRLLNLGRVENARAEWDVVDPDRSAQVPVVEARLQFMEGDRASARTTLARALRQNANDVDARKLQARLELADLNWDVAETALRKVLELDGSDIESWHLLAQVAQNQGKPADADRYRSLHKRMLDTKVRLHTLEQQASANPLDVRVRNEIVTLYEQMGQSDLAEFWRRSARTAAALAGQ